MDALQEKYSRLGEILRGLGSVLVAFSGGVDSTLLLRAAHDALGERAVAITAAAPVFPRWELEESLAFCRAEGIRCIQLPYDALRVEGFRENPENRCYLCKRSLFTRFWEVARAEGLGAVVDGTNVDDLGDYRPGLAAARELGTRSPLREAELSKAEIRALSRALGLPTWDKPSYACLASRFVYGETISEEKLRMVGQAEDLLRALGFRQFRVRLHGLMARLEVLPEDFEKLMEERTRKRIHDSLRRLGFRYVTLDLGGYRSGSMNDTVNL